MADEYCVLVNLRFSHDSQSVPLFRGLSLSLPPGWTGVVGANGSGKSTLARLICGELTPEEGSLRAPGSRHYCPQESGEIPTGLEALLCSPDSEDYRTIELLGVGADWPDRWETLSFGERKRAQLAVALFRRPALLALDEPTNHLDAEASARIRRALGDYRGIGILISHDRELLDALCKRCLFLENGRVVMRPGGISAGLREAEREREGARREHERAREELARLRREALARRALADSASSRLSGRRLSPKDRDGRGKLRLARVSGKDAVGGKLLRQMEARIEAAEARLREARAPDASRLGITIAGAAARRGSFFDVPAGELSLGERRSLLLALALGEGSELILLDEPTNHMDLPSLLCLEEALEASSASLLFVTHDMRFAGRLAAIRWSIEASPVRKGCYLLRQG